MLSLNCRIGCGKTSVGKTASKVNLDYAAKVGLTPFVKPSLRAKSLSKLGQEEAACCCGTWDACGVCCVCDV